MRTHTHTLTHISLACKATAPTHSVQKHTREVADAGSCSQTMTDIHAGLCQFHFNPFQAIKREVKNQTLVQQTGSKVEVTQLPVRNDSSQCCLSVMLPRSPLKAKMTLVRHRHETRWNKGACGFAQSYWRQTSLLGCALLTAASCTWKTRSFSRVQIVIATLGTCADTLDRRQTGRTAPHFSEIFSSYFICIFSKKKITFIEIPFFGGLGIESIKIHCDSSHDSWQLKTTNNHHYVH